MALDGDNSKNNINVKRQTSIDEISARERYESNQLSYQY